MNSFITSCVPSSDFDCSIPPAAAANLYRVTSNVAGCSDSYGSDLTPCNSNSIIRFDNRLKRCYVDVKTSKISKTKIQVALYSRCSACFSGTRVLWFGGATIGKNQPFYYLNLYGYHSLSPWNC